MSEMTKLHAKFPLSAMTFAVVVPLVSCSSTHLAEIVPFEDRASLKPSRDESWQNARNRLLHVVRQFSDDSATLAVIDHLTEADNEQELQDALRPLTLLSVSVNPESRVKISSLRARVKLREQQPQRFLVHVENTAGITAPLNLSAMDLATDPPGKADWCTIEVIDSPFTSREFTGARSEYKVMQITPHFAGLREVRIAGDAGQGTQDLGFRATTDVLLEVTSKGTGTNE